MVTIIKGSTKKPASSARLEKFFIEHVRYNGRLYIGYPILFAAGESYTLDALWISPHFGVIAFDLIEGNDFSDRTEIQDELFGYIESQLTANKDLKIDRKLAVKIEVITFAPGCVTEKKSDKKHAFNDKGLLKNINSLPKWVHNRLMDRVISVIQSVINLKGKSKREYVKTNDSRGAILKGLENTLATLDKDQEEAVIEYHEGLQRIRGLAGSGKTIVLALKAAYLHTQNPEWTIAVTFNTRALKSQFKELITRFCIEKKREVPDWSKIRVVNAWGGPRDKPEERGLYYDTCYENSIQYYDFSSAQNYSNTLDEKLLPFEAVCKKLVSEAKFLQEKYDAILVDEAQDLSDSFLNLCYKILKTPKRLVYAYDELQKLNEGSSLKNPKDIFKKTAKDTILKKCYRNSRPLLVTAHALGFGIYRRVMANPDQFSLVQFFDNPKLWHDVGYRTKDGKLAPNHKVKLFRDDKSSPEYLEKHSPIEDLLMFRSFNSSKEQATWVAEQIKINIETDELLHRDIVVINPLAVTTERESQIVRLKLDDFNIKTHVAGKNDADIFFENDSVTFTGINRAKGNEVPMVYIINAQDCYASSFFNADGYDLIRRRNTLFTAITRSKAWVRVCGVGPYMDSLISEYNEVKNRNFELQFDYPTEEQIKLMNVIHRDLTESEMSTISEDKDAINSINLIIKRLKSGQSHIEDYPEEQRDLLKTLLAATL